MKISLILQMITIGLISPIICDDIQRGITDHFNKWLTDNKFDTYNFKRTELAGGSYGGKQKDSDQIKNIPIIFIHGNGDVAVGTNDTQIGFTNTIQYLLANGYSQ